MMRVMLTTLLLLLLRALMEMERLGGREAGRARAGEGGTGEAAAERKQIDRKMRPKMRQVRRAAPAPEAQEPPDSFFVPIPCNLLQRRRRRRRRQRQQQQQQQQHAALRAVGGHNEHHRAPSPEASRPSSAQLQCCEPQSAMSRVLMYFTIPSANGENMHCA